ncbi:MAG: YggS family pyridoxal phosphate-dependent enzyme [Oscillatoriales cyanobacterium]|nr:MAG: YggS family pyridoxal phosphate-dependent enzyme [Oscillatoriales cyanobacterium]
MYPDSIDPDSINPDSINLSPINPSPIDPSPIDPSPIDWASSDLDTNPSSTNATGPSNLDSVNLDWVQALAALPTLADRVAFLRDRLPPSVCLVAVTKTFGVDRIREAYACGLRDFGENRVQEAEAKQAALADLPDIRWHLIGQLQSNKAKKAIEQFDWIHSVDRLDLAQRLDRLAAEASRRPQVCLQVKLQDDPTKAGWPVDDFLTALPELDRLEHLNICGLMAIPPLALSPVELVDFFGRAGNLADRVQAQSWERLSMEVRSLGMSNDWPIALAAGATMIRLGRTLFGDRAIG